MRRTDDQRLRHREPVGRPGVLLLNETIQRERPMNQVATVNDEAILDDVLNSPRDRGRLVAIVMRPEVNQRATAAEGRLSPEYGLEGGRWRLTSYFRLSDGTADPRSQLTLINSRLLRGLAGSEDRVELAGDQLVVDLDLSVENLPVGQRLAIGSAVIEITDIPHKGCQKFRARYGDAALQFVNSPRGAALRLRGLYARVIQEGKVRLGDEVVKLNDGS
jgi:hypothetical protein